METVALLAIVGVVGSILGWIGKTLMSPSKPGTPYVVRTFRKRQLRRKREKLSELNSAVERWGQTVHLGSHLVRSIREGEDWEARYGRIVDVDGDWVTAQWQQVQRRETSKSVDEEERISKAEIERSHSKFLPLGEGSPGEHVYNLNSQPPNPYAEKLSKVVQQTEALDLKIYRSTRR